MRIISQSNEWDFPYENTVLTVQGSSSRYYIHAKAADYNACMGVYDSIEKAEEVMCMLHSCYASFTQNELGAGKFIEPKIFIFPRNEEVTV